MHTRLFLFVAVVDVVIKHCAFSQRSSFWGGLIYQLPKPPTIENGAAMEADSS